VKFHSETKEFVKFYSETNEFMKLHSETKEYVKFLLRDQGVRDLGLRRLKDVHKC
jgi:hypothetical protein